MLIVLHGYGQLGRYFLEKFSAIASDRTFVIAPEGMHRFYLSGSSGRVGASWMTKEDRETDITDNLRWLTELIESYEPKVFKKRAILGFSQGGATAARLFNSRHIELNHLIMWASVFPPDIDREKFLHECHPNGENYFVLGEQDEYFSSTERDETLNFYRSIGFNTLVFNGKHTIEHETISRLVSGILDSIR